MKRRDLENHTESNVFLLRHDGMARHGNALHTRLCLWWCITCLSLQGWRETPSIHMRPREASTKFYLVYAPSLSSKTE